MIARQRQTGSAPVALPASAAVLAALLAALLVLSGCATVNEARGGPGQRLDPWESWNRKVFGFNESLDRAVLKPVATTYSEVVPRPVRTSISSFYNNFTDAWSAVNSLLQGQVIDGFQGAMRVATNTVFGVFGLMDVASEIGIESVNQDFGHTLARWGVGAGAYVVWPILGPSTVRESVGLPLDLAVSPSLLVDQAGAQVAVTSLRLVNQRSELLATTRLIDDIALDKYTFVRDAYLQRRGALRFNTDEADGSAVVAPAAAASSASAAAAAAAAGASASSASSVSASASAAAATAPVVAPQAEPVAAP